MIVGDKVKVVRVMPYSPTHIRQFVGKTGKLIKTGTVITTTVNSVRQKLTQHQVLFDDTSSWIFVDNEINMV